MRPVRTGDDPPDLFPPDPTPAGEVGCFVLVVLLIYSIWTVLAE